MKILLTGFDPFNNEKINPSWEAIKDLEIDGVHILQLPTSFKRAQALLRDKIDELRPDYVISIGQAGGRSKITFEQVAINLMDASIPDNDGYQPRREKISEDANDGYFTTIDIQSLVEKLNEHNIPAAISLSAGAYVCNTVLFTSLTKSIEDARGMKAGFIHIPYINEQVIDKTSDTPSMNLETIKKAIEIVLNSL